MGSGVCRHVPSRHGTVVHPCVPLQALSALTALSLRSPSHCSLIVSAGALEGVLEAMQAAGVLLPVLQLGLPDSFIEHGDPARLLALQGLDAAGIEAAVRKRFAQLL